MTLPNLLTLLRLMLVPVLILVFYLPVGWNNFAATAVFLIAAATDWLDGYLARKLNQSTPFGAFLDPVADKLMVAIALILLLEVHSSPWFAVATAVIIGREIVISALREWMAELGKRTSVAVSNMGKIKTFIQMAAIAVLLAFDPHQTLFVNIGYLLLAAAAGLTLWSMCIYLSAAWKDLKESGSL